MKSTIFRASVLAGMLMAAPGMLSAAAVTTNFNVTITINAECVVGAAGDLAFAATGYLTANVDAATSFLVGCTKGTQPQITLSNGVNSGAACTAIGGTRCMKSGSDLVKYDLYTDSTRATLWTSALTPTPVTGTGAVSSTTPTKDQTVNVYGRVPPQNTPTPGSYTDNVIATVTF